jgi:tetratricopeptide (TPR) repeat protein
LEQIEKSLAISPEDIEALRKKAILLGYLGNYDAAKEWVNDVVKSYPQTAETWALIGDVERDVWVKSWREDNKSPEEMAKNAAYEDSLLREAIKPYIRAFTLDPSHYYSGNSAFSLLLLLKHLTGEEDDQSAKLEILERGVSWALESALAKEDAYTKDFSARLCFADSQLLTNDTPEVKPTKMQL